MHYFLYTNGSKGATSFGIPYPVKKLYGYSPEIFKEISESLSKKAEDLGKSVEYIHSCMDGSVAGILFPELKSGVVNVPIYEESGIFSSLSVDAKNADKEIKKAHEYFKEALSIHDEWEKYYIHNFDFKVLDRTCEELSDELFAGKWGTEGGIIKDRFLGAATAYGSVDYIDDITKDIKTRYFIKGRPGSGKSTFLKKLAVKASERGYNVERYHCSFDPQSLDMIVIRGLSVCVFDSTAPHEHFPSRENDFIIDFYEIAAKRNIDREYQSELSAVATEYKEKINCATECIKKANEIYSKIYKEQEERISRDVLNESIVSLESEIFG